MPNRVTIDLQGLRISRPGVEVTTAAAADLTFNSNSGKYLSPYLQGNFGPGSYALVSSNYGQVSSFEIWQAKIPFGKTFASPPIVLAHYRDYGVTNGSAENYSASITSTQPNGTGGVIYRYTTVNTAHWASTVEAIFEIQYSWSNGYGQSKLAGPQLIGYVVGRF
jgi:hypothetical protein